MFGSAAFVVVLAALFGNTLNSKKSLIKNESPLTKSKLNETENPLRIISMEPNQIEKNVNTNVTLTFKNLSQTIGPENLEYYTIGSNYNIIGPTTPLNTSDKEIFKLSFTFHANSSIPIPAGQHNTTAFLVLRTKLKQHETAMLMQSNKNKRNKDKRKQKKLKPKPNKDDPQPIIINDTTRFLIFDCQSYTSCTECLPSAFPCDWSHISKRCFYDPTHKSSNVTLKTSFFHCNAKEILFVSIAIIVMLNFTSIVAVMAYRRKSNAYIETHKHMDVLESNVASECREAFAELQMEKTDMTEDFTKDRIPFLDYKSYVLRNLFPNSDHNVIFQTIPSDHLNQMKLTKELGLFKKLIMNRKFLLQFIRSLESNPNFSMSDRVKVGSLITVALDNKMDYYTKILKTLLSEIIDKYMDGKSDPKLFLRQAESVAEKMLSSWFTILLYNFVHHCAGTPLYHLFRALKQQVEMGPVDAITSEARYSLSEVKLIRHVFDYKPMTVKVSFIEHEHIFVKVLDCDTISQVKEKALDAIYRATPYSSRPKEEDVDVQWRNGNTQSSKLNDYDETNTVEGEWIQMNTLQHYNVPDNAHLILFPRESNLTNMVDKTESPGKKTWHLVKHYFQNNQKKERNSNCNKLVSEVYLNRLLTTKGVLQKFVNGLFQKIFSTHIGDHDFVPLPIRYMFKFLDDQALKHGIKDPEVVHIWKSNALPLRFWVNLIKNPNFVFDIHKSNTVDSCLSVVAQAFMDSCGTSDLRLSKDSPSSKLIYAKDIPVYKELVAKYYSSIKSKKIPEDQMNAMLGEEFELHRRQYVPSEVNYLYWALYELYNYALEYNEPLTVALEKDQDSRKQKLAHKLNQVRYR
uniref:Plexin-A4 n=1 Tax=Cacopsylla melanoneura TaxID=428564 RepID=A0A8D9BEI4_9HEMI